MEARIEESRSKERRNDVEETDSSTEHFIDHRTQTPPVDGLRVRFSSEYFRGEIFRCATERCCSSFSTFGRQHHFTKTEIGQTDVSLKSRSPLDQRAKIDIETYFSIEENILRFQISIDNVQAMEITDGRGDFRRVESCSLFAECSFFLQMEEELEKENEKRRR